MAKQTDHTPRILGVVKGEVVLDRHESICVKVLVFARRCGLHDHDRHRALPHMVPAPYTHVHQHLQTAFHQVHVIPSYIVARNLILQRCEIRAHRHVRLQIGSR